MYYLKVFGIAMASVNHPFPNPAWLHGSICIGYAFCYIELIWIKLNLKLTSQCLIICIPILMFSTCKHSRSYLVAAIYQSSMVARFWYTSMTSLPSYPEKLSASKLMTLPLWLVEKIMQFSAILFRPMQITWNSGTFLIN